MITMRWTRTVLRGWVLISLFFLTPFAQAQTAPPTWTQLSLSPAGALSGRQAHSAVYDATNNRMIVFGGRSSSGDLNDVWVLSNADGTGAPSWRLTPNGVPPSPRAFHTAVYDSTNNRMIVFGGEPSLNDVWVLSNANGRDVQPPTWTKLALTGTLPSRRFGHSAVYDAANNRMIIFGGETGGLYTAFLNDVWVLSNANGLGGTPTWTQLSPAGAIIGREMHSAIYDADNNRLVVFGGFGNYALLHDVWVLSNANGRDVQPPTWTELLPGGAAIPNRNLHSAVYDSATHSMTVFGGNVNYALDNDVWVLSNANGLAGTPAWTQLTSTGTAPNKRYGHSAVYRASNNRMIVFGGLTVSGLANDVWVLSRETPDLAVQIVIMPGEDSRPPTIEIEPGSDELITVAIASSPTFDPLTMVDRTSLTFGRTGDERSLAFCHDSSRDDEQQVGTHALICHFSVQRAGFQPADTIGILKGKTVTGTSFKGTDSIRIQTEGDNDQDNKKHDKDNKKDDK